MISFRPSWIWLIVMGGRVRSGCNARRLVGIFWIRSSFCGKVIGRVWVVFETEPRKLKPLLVVASIMRTSSPSGAGTKRRRSIARISLGGEQGNLRESEAFDEPRLITSGASFAIPNILKDKILELRAGPAIPIRQSKQDLPGDLMPGWSIARSH